MQTIYGMISDNGDGSGSMHWFRNFELTEVLGEKDPEQWGSNEGSPAETLTFPDDLRLEDCGFSFSDSEYEHLLNEEAEDEELDYFDEDSWDE